MIYYRHGPRQIQIAQISAYTYTDTYMNEYSYNKNVVMDT